MEKAWAGKDNAGKGKAPLFRLFFIVFFHEVPDLFERVQYLSGFAQPKGEREPIVLIVLEH